MVGATITGNPLVCDGATLFNLKMCKSLIDSSNAYAYVTLAAMGFQAELRLNLMWHYMVDGAMIFGHITMHS